jgi:hypothetical protein
MNFGRRSDSDFPATDEERLQERISAYLDGELTDAERVSVEAVLASDERAREVLEDLQLVRAALGVLEVVPAPRSFAIQATPARKRAGFFARFEMAIRASAAGVALLFVVSVATGGGLSVQTPTSPLAPGEVARTMGIPEAAASMADDSDGEVMDALAMPGSAQEGFPPGEGFGEAAGAGPERGGAADPGPPGMGGDSGSPGDPMPVPATAPDAPVGDEAPGESPAPEPAAPAEPEADLATGSPAELHPTAPTIFDTDERIGGVPLALGTVAALLAALSGVLVWARRVA